MDTKHSHDKSYFRCITLCVQYYLWLQHALPKQEKKKRAEEWERAAPEERCGFTAERPVAGVIYLWSKASSASRWGETNQVSPVELTKNSGREDWLQNSQVHCKDTVWSVYVVVFIPNFPRKQPAFGFKAKPGCISLTPLLGMI